jgi:hypothetical protein
LKNLILGPGQQVNDTSGYIVVQAPMNSFIDNEHEIAGFDS